MAWALSLGLLDSKAGSHLAGQGWLMSYWQHLMVLKKVRGDRLQGVAVLNSEN